MILNLRNIDGIRNQTLARAMFNVWFWKMAMLDRVGQWALSEVLTRPVVLRLVNIGCFGDPTRTVSRPEA